MAIAQKNIWHNTQEEQLVKALNSSAIISITNPEGDIIYVNDIFCEISGYTAQELIGKKHTILKSGKQSDSIFKDMWSTISTNRIWKGKICNKKKDGSFYWLDSTIIPFVDEFDEIEKYVAIRFDISKSIENKGSLKKMETKFKLLFDAAPDAYFISDLEGNIIKCNKAAELMSGYNEKELINKNICDSILISETDRRFFINILKIQSKKPHKFELQITTKKGKKIDVELASHHTVIDGEKLILNIAHNITERKTIHNDLRDKTKDLELLLYRSGHDLRTPFTSLQGVLNLIRQEAHNESVLELLDMFEKVLVSGNILVDNLSTSSLILNKSIKKEQVDFNQLVTQTLNNLKHLEGFNNISFNINIPEGLTLNSNPQLLSTIFQNLLQNAIKYQKPISRTHTPFIIINSFKTKDGIKISIKDNGIGINNKELDKVFDIYYRSNTTVDGTGLGLYIAKNTVEQLNGVISVKSIINKETQFDILLPNYSI